MRKVTRRNAPPKKAILSFNPIHELSRTELLWSPCNMAECVFNM
jgi:hypothetical protein